MILIDYNSINIKVNFTTAQQSKNNDEKRIH